ncbi:collagen triple helix repeat-containing protein 1 [Nematostella vectensis]|uniref:collagen triple helix repeat-containing protein 1 n=1 Tax=Nematostella vectensis TaxID=45351 RepID=UPI002076F768|nr:collagen triple helix repeat-containing protein 1 [Nematostella vectensis]
MSIILSMIILGVVMRGGHATPGTDTKLSKHGFGPLTFIAQAPGPRGPPGSPGTPAHVNWKQCVWTNINEGKDVGLIKECAFNKHSDSTALRVAFDGDYRVATCVGATCCKRWYFTFNHHECKHPAPIDAVQHHAADISGHNVHEHRHVEGYCQGIAKGQVRVGFWVDSCKFSPHDGPADAYTGWMSSTRIVIEEVPGPQA